MTRAALLRAAIPATPFDSLAAVGGRRYPMLPVSLLVANRYDSAALAPKIAVPGLFVLAGDDEITPAVHGEALARAWAGPKKIVTLPGGHGMVEWRTEYWRAVSDFLTDIAAAQRRF